MEVQYIMSDTTPTLPVMTHSDLTTWWRCPRRVGYRLLGYEKPAITLSQAILRGTLFDRGVGAWLQGKDYKQVVEAKAKDIAEDGIWLLDNDIKLQEALEALGKAKTGAYEMLERYTTVTPKPIALEVQELIQYKEAGGHPDAVLLETSPLTALIIVDYKTGREPDLRYLSMSGQVDYYAYLYELTRKRTVTFIDYQVISEQGIHEYRRPPRLTRGKRFFGQVRLLAHLSLESLLDDPHVSYDCSSCPFFKPCLTREAGGDDFDILHSEYSRSEPRISEPGDSKVE